MSPLNVLGSTGVMCGAWSSWTPDSVPRRLCFAAKGGVIDHGKQNLDRGPSHTHIYKATKKREDLAKSPAFILLSRGD